MVDAKKVGPPKNEWRTPPAFLRAVESHFGIHFTLDPCAATDNHLEIPNTFTEKEDGLLKTWWGTVWVNPPFDSKWIWVRKAYLESMKRRVDAWVLMEADTGTIQFHLWAPLASVYLIKTRIPFLNHDLKKVGTGCRGHLLMRFSPTGDKDIQLLDLGDWNR